MSRIVECMFCDQKNRVPDEVPEGKKVICGACKADLDDDEDEDLDDDESDDDEDDE
jgi:hypothetical protein